MVAPNEMYFEEESSEEESIDFKKYYRIILKRKWLILGIVIAISIPWLIYMKSLPPTYEAFCLIRFQNLAHDIENIISQSRITELKSRSFAEKVVAQLGLTLKIENDDEDLIRQALFAEFFTTTSIKSGDFVFRWTDDGNYAIHRVLEQREILIDNGPWQQAMTATHMTGSDFSFKLHKEFTQLPKEIKFKIKNFKLAVEEFRERTSVDVMGGGSLLKVTMTDHNAELVAEMVNKLAGIYINESHSLKQKSVDDRRGIIEDQLKVAKTDLDKAREELKTFSSTHFVSLNTQTEKQVADKLKAEGDLEVKQKQKEALVEVLTKIENIGTSDEELQKLKYIYRELASLSTFATNPKMGILRNQLLDLEGKYDDRVKDFSENNEKAIEFSRQIAETQLNIKTEAKQHLTKLSSEIAGHSTAINRLDYLLSSQLPGEQLKQAELEENFKRQEQLYNNLQTQLQDIKISEAAETEDIDILDRAIVPEYPVNRDKKKKAAMGVIFSVFVGMVVAFGIEFLDKSIKTVDDVKKFLKLEVIGTIPNIDFSDINDYQDSEKIKQIDQQLVTYDYSPTPIGEAYRSLRTNLVFSKKTGRVQTFVITSTAPGDGKSFTAANVAISMAQHKSNTLLIDADLRRGVLHNTFGVSKEPGFTNYLTGMVKFQHLINETLIPNLSMISCGSLLPNPSELLGSHQMKRFLDEAKRKFDIIIFDSPPLNAATDAIVIGTQVDAVVLVIRSGVTDRDMARQKMEMFKNVPAQVLGVVLNGTSAEFGHEGYSYYHY
ncbi:MAG: polysaccharide biosynthesis tyrosine autokinase [Candidatus Zhuqueibacterota bacterium]